MPKKKKSKKKNIFSKLYKYHYQLILLAIIIAVCSLCFTEVYETVQKGSGNYKNLFTAVIDTFKNNKLMTFILPAIAILLYIDRVTTLFSRVLKFLLNKNEPGKEETSFNYSKEYFYSNIICTKDKGIKTSFNNGIDALNSGNIEDAINYFSIITNDNQVYVNAYINLSICYLCQGKFQDAIDKLDEVNSLIPNQYLVLCTMSIAYRYTNPPKALEIINKAIKSHPDRYEAYIYKGNIFVSISEFNSAIDSFTQSIKLYSSSVAYNNRGYAYKQLNQFEPALKEYEEALEIDCNYYEAHINKGVILEISKDYDKAIKEYNTAIKIDNNKAEGYFNKGNIFYKSEKYEDAITEYNTAIEKNNEYYLAYINKGLSYFYLGKYQQSIIEYNKAISINGNEYLAYINKGELNRYIGKQTNELIFTEAAIQDFTKVLEINNKEYRAYFARGLSYIQSKNFNRAISDLQVIPQGHFLYDASRKEISSIKNRQVLSNPGMNESDVIKVELQNNTSNTEKAGNDVPRSFFDFYNEAMDAINNESYTLAISLLSNAINKNSNSNNSYYNRGYCYEKVGKLEEAIEDFSKAIELNPSDDEALNNRGTIYLSRDKYQKAIDDFTKALEINNSKAETYFNRAQAYIADERYKEGISDINMIPKDSVYHYTLGQKILNDIKSKT